MNPQATQVVDYYARLSVPVNASLDEIKSAYRNLAKRYHPDVYPLNDLATRERVELLIRQINEAYAILSDSKKRQSYDESSILMHSFTCQLAVLAEALKPGSELDQPRT